MKNCSIDTQLSAYCVNPLSRAIQNALAIKCFPKAAQSMFLMGCIGFHANASAINVTELDGTNGFKISGFSQGTIDKLVTYSIGDVNGDSTADILITNTANSNLIVFGNSKNNFPAETVVSEFDGSNGFQVEGVFRGSADINDDGLSDLLFNTESNSTSGGFVVYGQNTKTNGEFPAKLDKTDLDGTNGFRISDSANGGRLRFAAQGDVSGDGIDDIVVLERAFKNSDTYYTRYDESVYVIFGQHSDATNKFPTDFSLSQLDGTDGFRIQNALLSYSGYASTSINFSDSQIDFDGDGINDVFLINDFSQYRGYSTRGQFLLVSKLKDAGGFPPVVNGLPGHISETAPGAGFSYDGGIAKSIGDINGDGAGDVMSSYDGSYNFSGGSDVGSFITFGDKDALNSSPNGINIAFRDDNGVYFREGFALGDVNGDGLDDVLIDNYTQSYQLNSFVLFGRDETSQGSFPAVIDESYFDGHTGFKIITPEVTSYTRGASGDVNGDEINDIISVSNEMDSMSVFYGRRSPFPHTLSSEDIEPSTGFIVDGIPSISLLETADLNGDGADDVVSSFRSRRTKDAAVYVVFGTPGELNQPLLACAGDVDGNGSEDMAVLIKDQSAGTLNALVKDINGNAVSTVGFNGDYNPVAFKVMADINNNRSPELVVIDKNTARAEVRDSLTGELLNELGFHAQGGALDIDPLIDQSGNGIQELVSLNDKGKVNVKDAQSSQTLNQLSFSTSQFNPEDLSVLESSPANVAVLFENKDASKRDKVTIKDISTGRVINNLWYGAHWDVQQLELLSDQNGNGLPETAVLRKTEDKFNVMIRDAQSSARLTVLDYDSNYKPIKMRIANDLNNNGADEIVMLDKHRQNEFIKATVKDAKSKKLIKKMFFNKRMVPHDLAVCADMNGNNKSEIVVLGERHRDGGLVLIVKDAKTGQLLGTVDY